MTKDVSKGRLWSWRVLRLARRVAFSGQVKRLRRALKLEHRIQELQNKTIEWLDRKFREERAKTRALETQVEGYRKVIAHLQKQIHGSQRCVLRGIMQYSRN